MAMLLVRFTHSPYGNSNSQDGLDFALGATNYGHDVKVLFEGEGVLQLIKADSIKGLKNHSKRLASMPFFDIDECYICEDSANTFNVTRTLSNSQLVNELEAKWINADARVNLIQNADHVVTF